MFKSLGTLQFETVIVHGLNNPAGIEPAKIKELDWDSAQDYPDNEWGIMLAHFDAHIEWFRGSKIETKEQSIRIKEINARFPAKEGAKDWLDWQANNPELPSIPYYAALYDSMIKALAWIQNPPDPLRECLVRLASGHNLVDDDWPYFVLMYAEFRSCVEILFAWSPRVDDLSHERAAFEGHNRERWKRYAATFINLEMETHGGRIQEAREVFLQHVKDVIDEKEEPRAGLIRGPGLSRDDFYEFLDNPDEDGDRLKKWYRQDLTKNKFGLWDDRPD